MGGDGLKPVRSGDPLRISARAWNGMLGLLRQAGGAARGPSIARAPWRSGTCLVRNDSGADVDRWGVLGVAGVDPTYAEDADAFANVPVLEGDTPADPDHRGRFVIATEPIADGAVGQAVVSGLAVCQVDIKDAGHKYADIADGDAQQLVSGTRGSAVILHKPPGTGTSWCLVLLGGGTGLHVRYGKPTEAYTAGATLTLDPCGIDGADSGEPNVADVYVKSDRTSANIGSASIAGSPAAVSCEVSTAAVVPFYRADDGQWHVPGKDPVQAVTDFRVDGASAKFQIKVRFDFGGFVSSESDWMDVHVGTECP
ncbi:MAG TPA: hypothetical protein VMY35_06475 [Phycisphaerae bacterium]|nr:hypothetical protein [Phycisphaerae bacterium]